MPFTILSRLALLGLCIGLGGLFRIWYRARNNRLKEIPGPWHARYTRLSLKIATLRGRRIYHVHALHAKYGHYVRIAPNEIAVSDPEGFTQMHRIGTDFMKSEWYHTLTQQGERYSVFTMTNPKEHGARRRIFSRPMGHKYLLEHWHDTIREMTRGAVHIIRDRAINDGKVDILSWWTLMAMDNVVRLMYGASFNNLERGTTSPMMQVIMERVTNGSIAAELPIVAVIGKILQFLPIPRSAIPSVFHTRDELIKVGETGAATIKHSETSNNIFTNIAAEAEKGEMLDDEDVKTEAMIFTLAGTDTTAVTLTYLIWSVLSRPELQKELESEVATLPDNFGEPDIEKLPLLNAVIAENFRLHTALPTGLHRVVPVGGVTMGGLQIPAGATISTQAYTYHRDPVLFPNPSEFRPSRWVNDEVSAEGKRLFFPLGAGTRSCIGMHIAYMELRLVTAEFFRTCKGARLAPSVTPQSMEMENYFLVAPRGHKCEIVLPKY